MKKQPFPALLVVCLLASSTPSLASTAEYPWTLQLSDQDGAPFALSDYRGKTLLLGFIFTHCPSACPMQTARMVRVQKLLPEHLKERSAFVSISIDPRRDTVARLHGYARGYKAQLGHWRFGVSQDVPALQQLLDKLSVKVERKEDGSVGHEMVLILIDPQGRVAQRYVSDRFDEARVVREIAAVDRVAAATQKQ